MRQQVVELFEKGLEEDCYGLHGTSIEAIQYLAQHGRLPSIGVNQGELYFTIADEFEKALKETRQYALSNAQRHYFLSQLPFDATGEDLIPEILGFELNELLKDLPDLKAKCEGHGLSQNDLDRMWAESNKREGVVVSLSRKLEPLARTAEQMGGEYEWTMDSNDRVVQTPGGLELVYITGLE